MKIKQLFVLAGLVATTCPVVAQKTGHTQNENVPVQAIDQKIRAMYPNTTFRAIRPSVVSGLYEVVMGQNTAYTDSNGRYFVFGRLFDMKEQVDLTAQHQKDQQANLRVDYPSPYFSHAIKTVKGDGSRQLVIFSDPNCQYCKNLEKEIARLENITIYTFLYPVLGEDSKILAISAWCAPDKNSAWSDWMLRQIRPVLTSCVSPINDNTLLGNKLGVSATPTLIAKDGRILLGAASAEKINAWLKEVQ